MRRAAACQSGLQEIEVDRLGKEFAGAEFSGATAALVVTVRCHHHHRQIGPALLDLGKQIQSVHLGHVDVGEDHDQRRLYPVAQQVQRLVARVGEMHHIGAVAGFAAKTLAEHLGHIRLVIDNQNADAHVLLPAA